MVLNPLSRRTLWILGLGGGAAALGLGVWAATRPAAAAAPPPGGGGQITPTGPAGQNTAMLLAPLQAIMALPPGQLCQVNQTVTDFQLAWNQSGASQNMQVDGKYGPQTARGAAFIAQLNGLTAPTCCLNFSNTGAC
jgi:hypothetical protein